MKVDYVIGIDLGMKGGIAVIPAKKKLKPELYDMPLSGKTVDLRVIDDIISSTRPRTFVVIEKVLPFGRKSSQSNYWLGFYTGTFLTYCRLFNIPHTFVSAITWKRHFSLTGKDKVASVLLAESRGITDVRTKRGRALDGRADAYFIGLWALETGVYKSYES